VLLSLLEKLSDLGIVRLFPHQYEANIRPGAGLTEARRATSAGTFQAANECELIPALRLLAPIHSFGKTDCPKCWSHFSARANAPNKMMIMLPTV
jgi:hypothetical protein